MIKVHLISKPEIDLRTLHTMLEQRENSGKTEETKFLNLAHSFSEGVESFNAHLSYSFAAIAPQQVIYELLHFDLKISTHDLGSGFTLALISGDLESWKTALIRGREPTGLRYLFNQIYDHLPLTLRKVPNKKTFYLENK